MPEAYQTDAPVGEPTVVRTTLEALARQGAQQLLEVMLEQEVDEFLQRHRYERSGQAFRGYRNGYHHPREITVGLGPVTVRVPRVAQVPQEVAPEGYQSRLVHRYERVGKETQQLFARLYVDGLSTGDFEPVFRQLVGETAALSPNAIVRLKEAWKAEYTAWRHRPLSEVSYVYLWADGIYLGVGAESEKTAALCVLGARADGVKEMLAIERGYRESTESWAEVLRGLRDRGLAPPKVAIGDGALGLWAALDAVFPTTAHQRCWNHRVLNVQAKVPKRQLREVRVRLKAMMEAPTRGACERLRDQYAKELLAQDQRPAAETLGRDWEEFVTFYRYPKEHWVHLRTSNALESVFAGVRLRTDVAKRMRSGDNALYLVFKVVERLSQHWRPLNGGATLMTLVREGAAFQDGCLLARPHAPLVPAPT